MNRSGIGLTAVASLSFLFVAMSSPASAQGACGWYAVGGCFKQLRQADDRAAKLVDAYVARTDAISNFSPGWFCAVDGPYGAKSGADTAQRKFVRKGVGDAYVKKGGC